MSEAIEEEDAALAIYSQKHRLIKIHTHLGEDELLLQSFEGIESVSKLFRFDLKLRSKNRGIDFESMIGRPAAIGVVRADGRERFIHGLVAAFSQVGASARFAHYEATLVPWFWMLTQTSDCRIFQDKSVPDIIQQIFREHGFADFKINLHGRYEPQEYCVQYRETDFNFVSRLMEEQGIFYFFEHARDKHLLVMADSPSAFKPCPAQAEARYEMSAARGLSEDVVKGWSIRREVRPGTYTMQDFNFKRPRLNLLTTVAGNDARRYELYDYFGEYEKLEEGERRVGIRMDEQDASGVVADGSSTCRAFTSGYRFRLTDNYRDDLNGEYVLLSLSHAADQGDNYETSEGARENFHYENQIRCIPHPTAFRPPRLAPQPFMRGTQTAIVTGPPGEEIYVDNYGRVKVQFHWDREGRYDEHSSCWIRVSQNWAGKRWGAMFIPRIGQEVIVDFLEGDPDRPIITGRVYNGDLMPPYALPDEKTKSTVKSYSSKGGEGFNEIRFEDKKGSEQLFIHGEKDLDVRVRHERREWTGRDQHEIVKRDRLERVEGDQHLTVKGARNDKVEGTLSLTARQDMQESVGKNYALEAGTEIHLKSGVNLVIETGTTLTLKVGDSFINLNASGVYISGAMIRLNSQGVPGVGAGANPALPKAPHEADRAAPGRKTSMKPKRFKLSPSARVMKKAARRGLPFTEVCPRSKARRSKSRS